MNKYHITYLFLSIILMFTSTLLIVKSNITTLSTDHECLDDNIIHNHSLEHTSTEYSYTYTYTSSCWRCGASINSNNNLRCSLCKWYICRICKACDPQCSRCPSWNPNPNELPTNNKSKNSSSSSDNSWVIILIIIGAGVAYYFYKENKK